MFLRFLMFWYQVVDLEDFWKTGHKSSSFGARALRILSLSGCWLDLILGLLTEYIR